MDLEQVVKLLDLMESHGLDEVEVEQDGVRIRLRKSGGPPIAATPILATMPISALNGGHPAPAAAANAAPEPEAPAEDDGTFEVPSPMVGTFYRASAPDIEAFASEGDRVTHDSVICIIEAMKVMNEIKAEAEGEIVTILVENGESVEYGQPLMVLRKPRPA